MKNLFIPIYMVVLVLLLLPAFQANATLSVSITEVELRSIIDSMPAEELRSGSAWTIFNEDGSIQFSDETVRLLTDAAYRASKYPEVYDAYQVADLLDAGDVSFALWTIINLYKVQPEQVRVIAFKLADHGIRGSHYLNAFYTYAFADPAVMDYSDAAKPFLGDPQHLEQKLLHCRTLAAYTDKVIETQTGGK